MAVKIKPRFREIPILFPEDLYEELSRRAEGRGKKVEELIREACEIQYGLTTTEDRLEAVRELARLHLPVGDPEEMERESVPRPEDLLR